MEEQKPCNGCQERKLRVAERKIKTMGQEGLAQAAKIVPDTSKCSVVVLLADGHEKFIGKVTGTDYGWQRKGTVIIMDVRDMKADKRVARATQDTMRLVS